MWKDYDDFDNQIDELQVFTKKGLLDNKNKLDTKLKLAYKKYQTDMMADSLKKKENNEDPLIREKSL